MTELARSAWVVALVFGCGGGAGQDAVDAGPADASDADASTDAQAAASGSCTGTLTGAVTDSFACKVFQMSDREATIATTGTPSSTTNTTVHLEASAAFQAKTYTATEIPKTGAQVQAGGRTFFSENGGAGSSLTLTLTTATATALHGSLQAHAVDSSGNGASVDVKLSF